MTLPDGSRGTTAGVRLLVGAVAGICVGVGTSIPLAWQLALLLGWMSFAGVFLTWSWRIMWPMSGEQTRRHALREDPGRAATDMAVLAASFASLGAVAVLLMSGGSNKDLAAALSVSSVALSWAAVHTVFAMRYARLYFEPPLGGVDFNDKIATDGNGDVPPRYREFAYVAFTVGMTFQISDTSVTSRAFRDVVLKHMFLSYFLGAVVIAATINLVAGLAK